MSSSFKPLATRIFALFEPRCPCTRARTSSRDSKGNVEHRVASTTLTMTLVRRLLESWVSGRRTPVYRPSHRRSEEHTSELQSRSDLVCRLLLEKKKKTDN